MRLVITFDILKLRLMYEKRSECVRPAFDLLEKFDAEDLSAAAAQFDGALSLYAKEYEKAGLKPNVFDSIEAFEKMYLG